MTTVAPLASSDHDLVVESEERAALRATVRSIVATLSPPSRIRDYDERSAYDHELHRALGCAGFVALGGPERFGGAGDVRDQVAVIEELAAGPTTVAAMFVTQYIATQLVAASDVEEHRAALASVMRGESYISFALSESDGGTDVARVMRTRARRVDGGWLLNGEKMWTSAATYASHIVVLARTADWTRSPLDGVTMFVVPGGATGLSVSTIETLGVRGLSTCVVGLSDVFVADERRLGAEGDGFRALLPTLNRERMNSAAVLLGIARGALELSLEYAKQRCAFDRPIGGFQVLQHRLVDGFVALEEARGLLARAAAIEAASDASEHFAAMAKLSASRAAQSITQDGMQLMAGAGFSREWPMQRWFRDARLWTFAPASDEILRNGLGERLLGLPRSF